MDGHTQIHQRVVVMTMSHTQQPGRTDRPIQEYVHKHSFCGISKVLTSNSLLASNNMAPGSIDAILKICSVTAVKRKQNIVTSRFNPFPNTPF